MIARHTAFLAAVALGALMSVSFAAEPGGQDNSAKINSGQAAQPPAGAPPGSMTQSGSGDAVQNKAAPVGDAKAGAPGETPVPNPDEANAAPSPTESGPIGATAQTMPAKFSERNDKLDHLPIMALPLPLTDEQKQKIVQAVRGGSQQTVNLDSKPAMQVPSDITLNPMPDSVSSSIPEASKYRFIQLKDGIALVNPADRAVVGEIRQ